MASQSHVARSSRTRGILYPETLLHTGPVHAEQLQCMHGTCRPWPYSTHTPLLQGISTVGAGGQGEHECHVRHSDSSPIFLPCFVLLYHITLICILPTAASPCRCNLTATEVVLYAGWYSACFWCFAQSCGCPIPKGAEGHGWDSGQPELVGAASPQQGWNDMGMKVLSNPSHVMAFCTKCPPSIQASVMLFQFLVQPPEPWKSHTEWANTTTGPEQCFCQCCRSWLGSQLSQSCEVGTAELCLSSSVLPYLEQSRSPA